MNKNENPFHNFLIVHKSVLPSFFQNVIKARDLIEFRNYSITEACKYLNISRSTYYKYKDLVFMPTNDFGKKVMMALKMDNIIGTLSNVLQFIAMYSGDIISIHQETPIRGYAYATILIDIINLNINLEEFFEKLRNLENIVSVELVAIE